MTTTLSETRRKNVMITDLDQSDTQLPATEQPHRKTQRRRQPEQKTLHTMSGSFHRRSRSVECNLEQQHHKEDKMAKNARVNSYFNELLQTKDQQMEKLLQRLGTLHKYNEQFSEENRKLHEAINGYEQQIAGLRKQIANCDICQRLSHQLQQSLDQNRTYAADVDMMKTLVYRLNVQIEYYQDQLRETKHSDGKNDEPHQQQHQPPQQAHQSSISQWYGAVHTPTLAPLLHSYDEMLRDKEQLIQQYGQEFEHFTGELKHVLEENKRLLQQSEAYKRDFGDWREERTRLQAQLDVCRSKAEAQTEKSDLTKEKLVEVMQCYEQRVQTLVLDMDHLQTAYARCKSELAALKSVQSQDTITQSLQECKELLEQLKQQHTKEKQTLERRLCELQEEHSEVLAKMKAFKQENIALKSEQDQRNDSLEELRKRNAALQGCTDQVKRSRDRLKARLRIALQWAQKLEQGQTEIQGTWDALKRLEVILKHKESQVRGLHSRHVQEIDKMQKKLHQREETIRTILKGKLTPPSAATTARATAKGSSNAACQ